MKYPSIKPRGFPTLTINRSSPNLFNDKIPIDQQIADALLANNSNLLALICQSSFVGDTAASVSLGVLSLLKRGKGRAAEDFLKRLLTSRMGVSLKKNRDLSDILRDNSMATILLNAFARQEGVSYLSKSIGEALGEVIAYLDHCEIDPQRLNASAAASAALAGGPQAAAQTDTPLSTELSENENRLRVACLRLVSSIFDNRESMPISLRRMCHFLHTAVIEWGATLPSNPARPSTMSMVDPVSLKRGMSTPLPDDIRMMPTGPLPSLPQSSRSTHMIPSQSNLSDMNSKTSARTSSEHSQPINTITNITSTTTTTNQISQPTTTSSELIDNASNGSKPSSLCESDAMRGSIVIKKRDPTSSTIVSQGTPPIAASGALRVAATAMTPASVDDHTLPRRPRAFTGPANPDQPIIGMPLQGRGSGDDSSKTSGSSIHLNNKSPMASHEHFPHISSAIIRPAINFNISIPNSSTSPIMLPAGLEMSNMRSASSVDAFAAPLSPILRTPTFVDNTPLAVRLLADSQSRIGKRWDSDNVSIIRTVGSLTVAEKVIGSFLFLRFFVPAMTSPDKCGLTDVKISSGGRRGLVLCGKLVTALCNDVEFGAKEQYLMPLNSWLKENRDKMKEFLVFAASPLPDEEAEADTEADLPLDGGVREREPTTPSSPQTSLARKIPAKKSAGGLGFLMSTSMPSLTLLSTDNKVAADTRHSQPPTPIAAVAPVDLRRRSKSADNLSHEADNLFAYLGRSIAKIERDIEELLPGLPSDEAEGVASNLAVLKKLLKVSQYSEGNSTMSKSSQNPVLSRLNWIRDYLQKPKSTSFEDLRPVEGRHSESMLRTSQRRMTQK
ncbi:hypothetical protein SmJEL517_g00061 [Synchytrium microbalum]|uniref:Ras-GAP domain-containing protein n=1 Tax=Synchytrium microbalum TaxID=1806994 RepID=A0A507C8Y8_9FUNG|nr:uncharacterized protein SmJEL517_g00061 [Synchytrium microbalum]TPX38050.1 hypothetical protein SmJEL517_g00061 [Synchytrium microbalum]